MHKKNILMNKLWHMGAASTESPEKVELNKIFTSFFQRQYTSMLQYYF